MTRAILDFNFSAAPLGSESCITQLVYENTGAVTCDWYVALCSLFIFSNNVALFTIHIKVENRIRHGKVFTLDSHLKAEAYIQKVSQSYSAAAIMPGFRFKKN